MSIMFLATIGALILGFIAPFFAPTDGSSGGFLDLSGIGNMISGWVVALLAIIALSFVGVWWVTLIFPPILAFAIPAIFVRW
ncbi:MAG: hypothetical protein OSB62_05950 [Alphaproteobacteria bacterium]|jgi:hypothetical protein|nr:hypothetical protein [Alphaproteobacteria bacterium]